MRDFLAAALTRIGTLKGLLGLVVAAFAAGIAGLAVAATAI